MAGLSSFPGRAVFQQLVQDSVQTAGIVVVLIVARVYSTGFRLTMKEWPARIGVRRAVDGSVQLLYKTDLSAEEFISTQAWHDAKLSCCPMHPDGGCRFARHGSYGRKTPSGLRIARYYCPDSSMTFSLLPQFMAAGMAGTLQSVEDSVAAFEADGSLASAAERVRPGRHGSPRAARRWIRRRVECVRLLLATVIGLLPDLYAGTPIRIDAFRERTATGSALVELRLLCSNHLQALPPPAGFRRSSNGAGSQTGPPTRDGPCRRFGHGANRL